MKRPESSRPFWFPSDENAKTIPPLADRISVAIVGGGIVGLTDDPNVDASNTKVSASTCPDWELQA